MKKGLFFFLGFITGVLLTIVFLWSYGASDGGSKTTADDPGISMFDAPGDKIALKSFKVFQVLPNGSALANSSENAKSQYNYYGNPVVLFMAEDGVSYYDDQIIEVPAKKVVRQVGIYHYPTKAGMEKTVPIVSFLDK